MAIFEENEKHLNCFYDSDVNSAISDSDYELDEENELTDSDDEDDISVASELNQYRTDEEEEDEEEEEEEEDYELESLRILIHSILNEEIKTINEMKKNELIDNEDINMMYYFQGEYKNNYNFKISALRIIFAKIIIMKFNNKLNIKNITGLSITINPLEISITGLNNDEEKILRDFFIMYLEPK